MLTQSQIDGFHRDGFLRIPGVFAGEELAALRAASDRVEAEGIAATPDGSSDEVNQYADHHLYRRLPDGSRQYFRSERMWGRDPIFRAATVKPSLLRAIGQCLGHPFLPINDSLVAKQARSQTPIHWHQDPPYGDPRRDATFGVPNFDTDIYLDRSTVENGCVYGIPGKHLLGHLDLGRYEQEELFREFGAVPIEMEPGDVLFHCLSAPHGSRANPTDEKRRIFYVHYMAREVLEHCYSRMMAHSRIGFDAAGIAEVERFIADRAALGHPSALGDDLRLTAEGFVYAGSPGTEPWHWQRLIDAVSSEDAAAARDLDALRLRA